LGFVWNLEFRISIVFVKNVMLCAPGFSCFEGKKGKVNAVQAGASDFNFKDFKLLSSYQIHRKWIEAGASQCG